MDYIEKSCTEFLEALASKAPVPGGGGASALVGAVGVALCSMVGNLTVGKKKYIAVEADMYAILDKANKLRGRLTALVDEDAKAFEPLSRAYSIPRDNPDRKDIMDNALLKACEAPIDMMRCCCEALELLSETLEKGSVMLVSDVGVGTACCKAALEGASMNVFVNTQMLSDRQKAASIESEADAMLKKYLRIADSINNEVARRIRKKQPAKILKGAPVAEAINEEISRETDVLKQKGIFPALAIVRVGEREDDLAYERGAVKRCERVGVSVRREALPGDCTEEELIDVIKDLNDDSGVHGVLLLRPFPEHMDDDRVRNALAPEKDVDGITDISLSGVFTGNGGGYAPCTAQACIEILDYYGIEAKGKRAVVIGRSLVAGKPAAMMLTARNATVTVCHTRTVDMPLICREAEILVVSAGRPELADKSFFAPGQVVIDVGINVKEDGTLCGDIDFDAAKDIADAVTPVPGGVGTVTTSVLVKHVVRACLSSA